MFYMFHITAHTHLKIAEAGYFGQCITQIINNVYKYVSCLISFLLIMSSLLFLFVHNFMHCINNYLEVLGYKLFL